MSEASVQAIELPPVVDLDALDGLRDAMLDVIEHASVKIDCSKVERIATNGLIMLLSAGETASRNNYTLQLSEPSSAMQSALDRLGLAPSFSDYFEGQNQ